MARIALYLPAVLLLVAAILAAVIANGSVYRSAMSRAMPYMPATLLLIGALIVAGGTAWSGYRQSNFNRALREKNDKIISLQDGAARVLKGSDVVSFLVTSNIPYTDGKLELMTSNSGDLPVYDVYITIHSHVDAPMDTPENIAKAMFWITNKETHELGNIPVGIKYSGVFLDPGYYQIDIRTIYNKLTQILRFGPFGDITGQSTVVGDFNGTVFRKSTSPDGFPSVY